MEESITSYHHISLAKTAFLGKLLVNFYGDVTVEYIVIYNMECQITASSLHVSVYGCVRINKVRQEQL